MNQVQEQKPRNPIIKNDIGMGGPYRRRFASAVAHSHADNCNVGASRAKRLSLFVRRGRVGGSGKRHLEAGIRTESARGAGMVPERRAYRCREGPLPVQEVL